VYAHFVFLIITLFNVKKTKRAFTFSSPRLIDTYLHLDNGMKKEEKTLLTKIKTPTHNHPNKKKD
jgi:hypothetical protein